MITNIAPPRLDEFTSPFSFEANEDQDKTLTAYLALWRYAWDWALAEWKLQERLARDVVYGQLPTIQWLEDKWNSLDKSTLPKFPNSIGAMAVSKLANSYMLARMTGRNLPEESPAQIWGTFRIAVDDCSLTSDRKLISVGDAKDMRVTKMPYDIEWKDVRFLNIRKLSGTGWSGMLIGWSPTFCESGLHNITYGELPDGAIADEVLINSEQGEI